MKRFIREYRVELAAVLIGLMGVFLIVEQIDLRRILFDAGKSLASHLNAAINKTLGYFLGFSLSDLLGWMIIGLVLVLAVWRIRYRFSMSDHWEASRCPRCGSELHRVHRSRFDHLLSATLLPDARRYRCADKSCGWTGLRRRRPSDHHHHHTSS